MKTLKNNTHTYSRRNFMRSALFGTGALLTLPSVLTLSACTAATSKKATADPNFNADIEIDLKAVIDKVQILPGSPTQVWRYKADVRKGPAGTVQNLNDTFTGPVFRFKKGQKVRIYFKNELPEESIVHWHGLHIPELADGHPRFVIGEGQTFVYEFEIVNRVGTYWFHPHPHGRTGPQVYNGLAGLFIITDDEEQALDLPTGKNDIPLVIQDRTFDRKNQLVYLQNRMQRMTGFLGNTITVNGNPNASMNLDKGTYRLRVLNGSNSRIYKLAWSDNTPLTAIATDGGLLASPVTKPYIMLGPAERVDLWVDLSNRNTGDRLTLKSKSFEGGSMGGMGGGMMGGGMMGGRSGGSSAPGNGDELTLLSINIKEGNGTRKQLPEKLSDLNLLYAADAVNKNNPRTFRFEMKGMDPTINGRTFKMTKVASDEVVKLNTTEMWRLKNENGSGMMGGMMQMPHPVHIHGLSFHIVNRTKGSGWKTIKDGFIDNGWKDTALLFPGMTADVVMRFEDYPGLFLYQCHNLEHEDLGMMRNYLVK